MSERDVERDGTSEYFARTFRRIADAVEEDGSFRIQVANARFTVPADAVLSVEHEVGDGEEELEFQLKWPAND